MTPQVENQCEEGFTLDQVLVTGALALILPIIERKTSANIKMFYAVHDVFFSNGKGFGRTGNRLAEALQAKSTRS